MDKMFKKQGVAYIIIAYALMVYFIEDVYFIYKIFEEEFIINVLMVFAAYILILIYGSWKKKKDKINETVYYISTMISGIFYLIIINVIFVVPEILYIDKDRLYKLLSNYKVRMFIESIVFRDYIELIYKYGGLYTGLLMFTIIKTTMSKKLDSINKQNNDEKTNTDYNAANHYDFQKIENNSGISLLADEQKTDNTASIISGMKAGLIIILCQGMSGIILYTYYNRVYFN